MRTGIIRHIPTEMDPTDLVNSIETTAKILSIQRLNQKIKIDGETKFVPSKTILIKFKGQLLLPVVSLFKIRLPVYLYIPRVQLCYNCYRFGHISTNCKEKTRCLCCGGANINEECPRFQQPPIYCNCGGEHLSTIPNCPSNIKQKQINTLASIDNISLLEARMRIGKNRESLRTVDKQFSQRDYLFLSYRPHNLNYQPTSYDKTQPNVCPSYIDRNPYQCNIINVTRSMP
ncbi:hypothetical protein ACFW04_014241 [Cataglyphis niger]